MEVEVELEAAWVEERRVATGRVAAATAAVVVVEGKAGTCSEGDEDGGDSKKSEQTSNLARVAVDWRRTHVGLDSRLNDPRTHDGHYGREVLG